MTDEQRETEERLAQFQALIDHAREGMFVTDQAGRFVYVNKRAYELLGYEEGELLGLTPHDLIHPDDQAVLPPRFQELAVGQEVVTERYLCRKDGTLFPAEVRGTLLANGLSQAIVRDLSQQQAQEEALRQAQREAQTLFEHAHDAILLLRPTTGTILEVNQRACELYARARAELIGHSVYELTQEPESDRAHLQQTLEETTAHRFETMHQHRDGSELPVAINASVVTYQGRRAIMSIHRDLTARRRLEALSQQAHARYQGIVEDQSELLCRFLPDGTLTFVNQAYCRYVGQPTSQLLGSNFFTLLPKNERAAVRSALRSLRPSAPVTTTEQQMLLPDGAAPYQRWTLRAIFDDKGQISEIQAVGFDISERKRVEEAERNQRQLAESLVGAAMALNRSLDLEAVLDRILEQTLRVVPCRAVNLLLVEGEQARVARHRGYEAVPDSLAHIDGLTLPLSLPTLQQMQQKGEPILIPDTDADMRWQKTPVTQWVRSYAGVPLKSTEGIIGFLNVNSEHAYFFDQETTRRLEAFAAHAAIAIQNARLFGSLAQALQQEQAMRDQLIQASKLAAMGRLVASISHEINNPLQAVQGCLTLAREEIDEAGVKMELVDHYLTVATSEIQRIISIVQRTRDFYRPAKESLQPSHPHHILDSVLELTNKQFHYHELQVVREWAEVLPLIECNPDHLKQVFLNLILNAIDAMAPQGQGTLTVRTRLAMLPASTGEEEGAVCIELSDTGEGIPQEHVAHIFEPFYTTKAQGTGLGLSISYRIIEAHHGKILVQSEAGQGTTFTLLLPLRQPPTSEDESLPLTAATEQNESNG